MSRNATEENNYKAMKNNAVEGLMEIKSVSLSKNLINMVKTVQGR